MPLLSCFLTVFLAAQPPDFHSKGFSRDRVIPHQYS
jgi:hypothetical protein